MPQLTLYTYWRSSASHRVRIALGYKGLAYEPIFAATDGLSAAVAVPPLTTVVATFPQK